MKVNYHYVAYLTDGITSSFNVVILNITIAFGIMVLVNGDLATHNGAELGECLVQVNVCPVGLSEPLDIYLTRV